MDSSFKFMTCSKCGDMLSIQEMLVNHHTDSEGTMHPLCNKYENDIKERERGEINE